MSMYEIDSAYVRRCQKRLQDVNGKIKCTKIRH